MSVAEQQSGSPDKTGSAERAKAVVDVAATEPQDINSQMQADATAWFLSDNPEEVAFDWIKLNVGGPRGSGREKDVPFKIGSLPRERINEIRRESERMNARGAMEVDAGEANLKIAVEGLLVPNISGDPAMRKVRGQQYQDPADALRARFAHKDGLIDQIANKIVELSGYDDKDVMEVRAAGN